MKNKYILACILLAPAFGQTQVDLGNQSKNVDFSKLPMVRPFRSGALLPATCVTGEMFFNTSAPAGSNSFGCAAPNSWVLQGAPAQAPLQVTLTNPTTLVVGSGCTIAAPCIVRIGSIAYTFVQSATISLQSGSGLAYIYVSSSGAVTVGTADASSPALACTGCQLLNPIAQFPVDSIPLATWNASSGTWGAAGTDERAFLSGGRTLLAGPNIIITESGSNVTISYSGVSLSASGVTPVSGTYDPTDMTTVDRSYIFSETGYNAAGNWRYTGTCGNAGGVPSVVPGEVPGLGWGVYNGSCFVTYPGGDGGAYPLVDFLSGPAPLTYFLEGRYAIAIAGGRGAGDQYVGWAQDTTLANFVGFRYLNSANVWQCVIRAANADVASQVLPATPDSALHTFVLSNGGTPNSVTCKLDSGSTTTTGTIPSGSWYGLMGTIAPNVTSYFTAVEARYHISGMAR